MPSLHLLSLEFFHLAREVLLFFSFLLYTCCWLNNTIFFWLIIWIPLKYLPSLPSSSQVLPSCDLLKIKGIWFGTETSLTKRNKKTLEDSSKGSFPGFSISYHKLINKYIKTLNFVTKSLIFEISIEIISQKYYAYLGIYFRNIFQFCGEFNRLKQILLNTFFRYII